MCNQKVKSNILIRHPYKLILVEWIDSVLGFQGWKFLKEQPRQLTSFLSVGFLVHEDDKCIVIYPHIDNSKDDDDTTGSGDIIIPKTAIRKIKTLT
jgi:hypothetical protein